MAKRKKHRKTKAQKRAKQQNSVALSSNKSDLRAEVVDEQSKVKVSKEKPDTTTEMTTDSYVKSDILRSLTLIGVILAVYVVLFFLLEKTSVGIKLYSLIKF